MAKKHQPTALKILAGNPGKRPLNAREPKVESRGTLDKPPAHVKGAARKLWVYLLKTMPKGVLTGLDVVQLEMYCQAYASYHEACAEVEKHGQIVLSPEKGIPMQSPWVSIRNKQAELMIKLGSSIGLDPASRAKIQVQEQEPGNPFDEF